MNRNHQSQNNQNHTARGHHNPARRSMHSSAAFNPRVENSADYNYTQYVSANPNHYHNDNDLYDTSGPDRDYNYRSDGPGPIELESGKNEVKKSYEGIGPKGYKRADRSIEEDICEMLMQDRYVDAENISVTVENGIVKLGGTVMGRHEKFKIEEIAEIASGVNDIVNEIRVVKN